MKVNAIYNADCVKGMASLDAACADIIIIDGPYFKTKGDFDFVLSDNQWFQLYENTAKECKRILKPNGTIYVYGHALKIAYQQVIFDKYFSIINSLVWHKIDSQANRNSPQQMRSFAPVTERILMYAHAHHSDNNAYNYIEGFEPIRSYLEKEIKSIGINTIAKKIGITSRAVGHWVHKSQWTFPSMERYAQLQKMGICKKSYSRLKSEYDNAKTTHSRCFNTGRILLTDVLAFSQEANITQLYDHETQKPPKLTELLIQTSSNVGDLVVVPFVGSGTECEAAKKLGRDFIGWETDKKYCETARKRLK